MSPYSLSTSAQRPIVVFGRADAGGELGTLVDELERQGVPSRACCYEATSTASDRLGHIGDQVRGELGADETVVLWSAPPAEGLAAEPLDPMPDVVTWAVSDLFAAGRVLQKHCVERGGVVVIVAVSPAGAESPRALLREVEHAAARSFTRVLAAAIGPHGRCNALCVDPDPRQEWPAIAANIAFLSCAASQHMTGQMLTVSEPLVHLDA